MTTMLSKRPLAISLEHATIAESLVIERPIVHFKKMETVEETTKMSITIVGMVSNRANSKESVTIAEKLGTKKPIAGRNIPRRSQRSTGNLETRLGRTSRS